MVAIEFAGESGAAVAGGLELLRGAIAGALVVSAAYLAGYAVLRRGPAAVCALLMVLAAGALQFGWLGFQSDMSPKLSVLLQGFFGAAAIIYVSSVAKIARRNALIGGVMFAGALTLIGVGLINLTGRSDLAGLMRMGLIAVGATTVILGLWQWKRDPTVRLLLPGAVLAGLAPFTSGIAGAAGEGFALLPPALFALGVIAASLVAMTEENAPRISELGLHDHGHHGHETGLGYAGDPRECETDADMHCRLSETQLAKVADYAGVSVWDWCPHGAHQTDGMPTLMGADSRAPFTPEAIKAFIHKDDLGKLESKVLAASLGDGAFDLVLRLHDGRHIRFRGARAVDDDGALERIVAFIEGAPDGARSAKSGAPAATGAALSAVAASRSAAPLQHNNSATNVFGDALAKGEITTVFQPIVSLDSGKVAGFETLARWSEKAGGPGRTGAEELVRAAEAAGKGGALARFVLNEAAQFLAREIKNHGKRDIFVALNLSFSQMRDPGFPAAMKRAMSEHGLQPKSLVLELTESQAITEKGAAEIFKALRDAGAALAFDDFGSGFSSLSNLRKYAFDYLKIDKSFIDGLVKGNESAKIAQAIAALGRDLGLTVIAEGVETRETADAAKRIGCTLAQGYAFGAPGKSAHAKERDLEPALRDASQDKKQRRSMWRGDLR